MVLWAVFGFAIGASIGSFAAVVAARVPKKMSVVKPPSHCFSCNTMLTARDNIPILSWPLQRGRCRYCKAAIPISGWLIEVGFGIAGALIAALLAR